jgi:hypothetical protein
MKVYIKQLPFALLAAATILLLATVAGCKKNALPADEGSTLNERTKKIKTWFEARPAAEGRQKNTASSGSNMPPVSLQWNNTSYFAAEHAYIVPAAIEAGNSAAFVYLVITEDAQGGLVQANYTMALPDKTKMSAADIGNINAVPVFLQGRQVPATFAGALLHYSSSGAQLGAVHYEAGQAKTGYADRLTAKKATESNAAASKAPCGERVCTDWYWQTYIGGILVDEEYLFTTCVCDGGVGGGGMGEDDNALLTQFNNYVQFSSTPVNAYAPITADGPDPISYTHTWLVAKGLTGSWSINATTQMDYYHKTMYNLQLNSLEHVYDVVNFKTLQSFYQGTNNLITSTWNPFLPVDQVYNNNSMYAYGVSRVSGTIKHVANFQIPNPFGNPITLDREDHINNSCNTYPK